MITRGITKLDYDEIVQVMDQWWGGPAGTKALPIFFYEFGSYALIAEEDQKMIGFLLGFMTDRQPRIGYVHLLGIHPQFRLRGVARALYEDFERRAHAHGASRIKCITTQGNEGSVHFHEAMGYRAESVPDYAGPGRDRVVFTKELGPARSN